jgi:O-antigen ligase
LTGLLLAVHLIGFGVKRRQVHPASWWFLPFLAYAAVNVIWVAPARWLGWLDWLGWAQMIAVFWIVLNGVQAAGPRRLLLISLAGLGAVAVALACFQKFVQPDWLMMGRIQAAQYQSRPSGPFGAPNSFAAFLLMLIPAAGVIGFRKGAKSGERIVGRALLALLSLGFVFTISRGGWIALALALTVWPLIARRVAWWRRVAQALGVLVAAIVVVGLLVAVVPLARARFQTMVRDTGELSRPIVWRAAWQLFRSAPAVGTGAGSFNVLFERHRPERFRDEPQWAHNEYLNTLSDYGLVGFVLFFGPCVALATRGAARRREGEKESADWAAAPALPVALGIGLLAFAVQIGVDYHLKIPSLAMLAATLSGLATGLLWPTRRMKEAPSGGTTIAFVLAGAVVAAGFALAVVPLYRGEALRYSAKEKLAKLVGVEPTTPTYRNTVGWVMQDLLSAVTLAPANGQAWADLSYATSLEGHAKPGRVAELGRQAEAAAERALAISQVHADFWIRRGVGRDMQGRWLEAGTDFTQATAVAPSNAWAWYYYAEHFYRQPTGKYLAEAALAFCLRLDPGNEPGLALRQRLAISQSVP